MRLWANHLTLPVPGGGAGKGSLTAVGQVGVGEGRDEVGRQGKEGLKVLWDF